MSVNRTNKKPTSRRSRRLRWLIRRNKKNLRRRRRLSRRGTGYSPDRTKHFSTDIYTRGDVKTVNKRWSIDLPEVLDFDENYESTVSHFRTLRSATSGKVSQGTVNFDKLRFISPSAALVLASEVDRWNQKLKGRIKAHTDTWHPDIMRLLCQMGYFQLLEIPIPEGPLPYKDMNFLRFKRGTLGNPDKGSIARELRQEIEALTGTQIHRPSLYEGLSEAITNVGHHAYGTAPADTVKQWWLSASYERSTRTLGVTFYDQGVGIPRTLPNNEIFESIKHLLAGWTDSEKIKAAMEIGRSATGLAERGKGLRNLKEFIKVNRQGQLSVYSSRGLYKIGTLTGGVGDPTLTTSRRDFKISIGGTLIEWSVILPT